MTAPIITYRDWHPVGRAGITDEERATFLREMPRYPTWLRGQWAKLTDEQLMRRMQLAQVLADRDRSKAHDNGVRALRGELRRRSMVFAPARDGILIPRCEICSHGSERVFQASSETHDIERNDEPCVAFLCVRCWSELRKEED